MKTTYRTGGTAKIFDESLIQSRSMERALFASETVSKAVCGAQTIHGRKGTVIDVPDGMTLLIPDTSWDGRGTTVEEIGPCRAVMLYAGGAESLAVWEVEVFPPSIPEDGEIPQGT